MQADLASQLQEIYPDAFSRIGNVQFSFDCGEGWYPIIDTLCYLVTDMNRRAGQQPTFIQSVTEKLGTLRVLVSGRVPESHAWIIFAEQHSTRTCEICGDIGRLLFADGWQRVRCENHVNERSRVGCA